MQLADLKLFVVKYGVGILNNGTAVSDSSDSTFPPVTQSSVEEQIDTMTTAIATLKKLVNNTALLLSLLLSLLLFLLFL